jgi:hypothetical protein
MRRMEEMEHQVKEMEAKVFKLKEATTDDIE